MRARSTTDHPDAIRVQVDLLRRAGPAGRFRLARSLTRTVISLSLAAIRRNRPTASEEEVLVDFLALHHGEELAARVRDYLRRKAL